MKHNFVENFQQKRSIVTQGKINAVVFSVGYRFRCLYYKSYIRDIWKHDLVGYPIKAAEIESAGAR